MNAKRILDRPSYQNAFKDTKRERSFELSLPALVNGIDAVGKEFQEYTELISLSSQEAIFKLDSKVIIGSKLSMSLDIPKTLFLENQLKLEMSGNVRFVKAEHNDSKKQLIILRLNKNYKINTINIRKS
ncbi:MAG: hypothetical protein JSV46_00855 [Candidatus Aminicenantes bacterium]|nr:MAG: hypothetical protein JSV46_00855 [Candidatus Aminicenantes bacterium]